VGQSLGAEKVERAERTARAASLLGGASIALFMGLGIAFPEPLLRLFVDSPDTIATGVPMIRILGASFIVASFAIALACVFTGSGYNLPLLISSLAGRWGAQFPFLLLSTYVLPLVGIELGIVGVWLSFLLSDLVESSVIVFHYRRGKWKKVRAFTAAEPR